MNTIKEKITELGKIEPTLTENNKRARRKYFLILGVWGCP